MTSVWRAWEDPGIGTSPNYPCLLADSNHAGVDLQAGLCVISTNAASFMDGSLQGVIPIFVNEVDLGFAWIQLYRLNTSGYFSSCFLRVVDVHMYSCSGSRATVALYLDRQGRTISFCALKVKRGFGAKFQKRKTTRDC